MKQNCPLCDSNAESFFKEQFYLCNNCKGIFRPKSDYPNLEDEKQRYEKHNNDINDNGYQNFVSPITNAVIANHKIEETGLDFGAGSGPVISKILKDKNFQIELYDPFFHNYPELLEGQYDYIVCCEVIEHLHNPAKEFALLFELLKPYAKLYCMTHIYDDSIDFGNWYYKNDITHVIIYQKETLKYIAEKYKFSDVVIEGRLITYTK